MEDTKAAIIKLKMYKQKQEVIEMKESQLVLLESARIKTSKLSDESGGTRKDIYEQLEDMLVKKEELRLEIIKLRLEQAAVDTALKLMDGKGKLMEEAKEIIKLRHMEDKSLMEIEIDLDMSESTVKRRLKKGEIEFTRLLKLA